jgi:hypothetical protein
MKAITLKINRNPSRKETEEALREQQRWRNIVFIEDIAQLDKTPVGSIVALEYGDLVYTGKRDNSYLFITRRTPGTAELNVNLISQFRGTNPFITRDGRGLLDFQSLRNEEVCFAYRHPEKVRMLEAVGE